MAQHVDSDVHRYLYYLLLLPFFTSFHSSLFGQGRYERFTVILEDRPLAEVVTSKQDIRRLAAQDHLRRIELAQQSLRHALDRRQIHVIGATRTLLNAVYVRATEEQAQELRSLPGVIRVEPMLPLRRHMNRAVELVKATSAWEAVGGEGNAGAGVKIGILDTGIDQSHPAFQDTSLTPPPGFPKCFQDDCAFTNNKVIVARSYVEFLVLGDEPEFSRPDDTSPRDRVGHGTATAMVAAGVRTSGPAATVSGIAPKAFLGNYKIFGSPGVNDVTFDSAVFQAMEDALSDGMDIIVLALGRPALWGPNDLGSDCGNPGSQACDPRVDAVENAVRLGLTVVVSAGNDGDLGVNLPTLNSIHTPATAPSAISVGASTNSHIFFSSVRVTGSAVPAGLAQIPTLFGNGPKPQTTLTAPLRDVLKLEDDGKACSPLANGSLAGAIALIQRGDCGFSVKVNHAQKAGAVGAVIVQREGSDFLFPMTGLTETGIPAVLIGSTDGAALRTFLATHPDRAVTLDPKLEELNAEFDTVAFFSSQGPAIGDLAIKPELVAVGTDVYMATQNFDPNGDMYDPSRYTALQGTSFAAPMVAGAAALVKQRNPGFTPAQLKSAVVNTATDDVDDFDGSGRRVRARTTAVGAGKLHVDNAVRTTVTAEPATLSFGAVASGTLPSRGLRIANRGATAVNLTLEVQPADPRVVVAPRTLTLQPGDSPSVVVRLDGRPGPGSYEGSVVIRGGPVTLRVPYLYLVGDGVPFNAFPLRGLDFIGNVNEQLPGRLTFKVVDQYGVPVANLPVRFRTSFGGGLIDTANERTDLLGIAEASRVFLGPEWGEQEFTAEAGGLTVYFPGRARLVPTIQANGVVNTGSFRVGQGLAPGSYISVFGRNLSEATRQTTTTSLPLSLAGVSVSFDAPARRLSRPGRLHFVSDGQINVQIPWEFQGLTSVLMKVSIGDTSSALYTVPLNDYAPAFFEYTEPSSGRLLLAALDEGFRLVGTGNPAQRGRFVQLFANGLGPLDRQPPSGEPTPSEPLSRTRVIPTVTIGGQPVEVQFSGLAPLNVGLYQVNVRIGSNVPAGIQQVVITANGVSSKAASLPIQ